MSANKHLIALAIAAALTVGQSAVAQETGDSAYQWGRWAVLSPAAGGEPFRAPDAPGAVNNFRPDEFFPVTVTDSQPVTNDPRDRLPPRPTLPPPVTNNPLTNDPRDRLPPRPTP